MKSTVTDGHQAKWRDIKRRSREESIKYSLRLAAYGGVLRNSGHGESSLGLELSGTMKPTKKTKV